MINQLNHFDGAQDSPSSVDEEAASRLNILILDDSYADFDALRRALNRVDVFSASVKRAKTIEEARLACSEGQVDVAFIDYDLGLESGVRFLQEIGGRDSEIIPILVTGLKEADVQNNALKAGAVGLIDKADISPTLLASTIRAARYAQHVEKKLQNVITQMTRVGVPT